MQLSSLTKAISIQPAVCSPAIIEQLNSATVTDNEVVNMFNKAKSQNGNVHDLHTIAENLFTRKLKQLRKDNNTKDQINIIADMLAVMFFSKSKNI